MIQKITIVIFLSLLSTFAWAYSRACPPENPYVLKSLRLPCFNSIKTDGDLDIQLEADSWRQSVTVAGKLKSIKSLKISVEKNTLHIDSLTPATLCSPRPKIRIAIPTLEKFDYAEGSGTIQIRQSWPSHSVCMNIRGNPKVSINGNLKLSKLVVGGNTQISVYWINSCDFYLKAMNNARIYVAGKVDTLEVDTFDSACVNAKYLRAKRAFVKSYDNSRLDLRASCSLNALASQQSAIYYYQDPRFQAPYMEYAGSVIKMTRLCCPPCSICDNACCKNGWH